MGSTKTSGKSNRPKKPKSKIPNDVYEAELFRLQTEFVKLQEWARHTGARIAVIFEGRDAAGKGGTIKRITEHLSPRVARIAALPAPTDRERGQWYYQRYVAQLPAKGEIVLFDRSWYNRAGVEQVMGFCTPQEHTLFLRQTPVFEQMSWRTASCCASTGSRCPTMSSCAGSSRGSMTLCASGSCLQWTSSRCTGGRTIHGPRTR